jgi:5-hydroxyisourate hydrolase
MRIERLSTHLLDTTIGKPAAGIPVTLEAISTDGTALAVGSGVTDVDGRVGQLNTASLEPGEFRLVFATADYFRTTHGAVFYPRIAVQILLPETRSHFHIPVLASTFSYSTYLGS